MFLLCAFTANFYFITFITIVDLFLCLLFLSNVYVDCQVANPIRVQITYILPNPLSLAINSVAGTVSTCLLYILGPELC